MNMDFANGMRAAMRLIQAQKLMQATRVIRRTLSGGAEPEPATEQAAEARAIEGPVIDLTAEVVEPEVTNVPEGGASLAAGIVAAAERWCLGAAHGRDGPGAWRHRASKLQSRSAESRQTKQDCRRSGRRSVPEPVLCLRRREPRLQALYSSPSPGERARAAGDAAWRHAGWRRLRGGDAHERPRRGAWIYRRLSEPVQSCKRLPMLELVHARAPEARGRRALDHCRASRSEIVAELRLSIRTACS